MIQESLTNIARHAHCSEAGVRISRVIDAGGEALEVVIADNGQGFDPHAVLESGLQGMRERICKLGGEFNVDTESGQSVAIRAILQLAHIA